MGIEIPPVPPEKYQYKELAERYAKMLLEKITLRPGVSKGDAREKILKYSSQEEIAVQFPKIVDQDFLDNVAILFIHGIEYKKDQGGLYTYENFIDDSDVLQIPYGNDKEAISCKITMLQILYRAGECTEKISMTVYSALYSAVGATTYMKWKDLSSKGYVGGMPAILKEHATHVDQDIINQLIALQDDNLLTPEERTEQNNISQDENDEEIDLQREVVEEEKSNVVHIKSWTQSHGGDREEENGQRVDGGGVKITRLPQPVRVNKSGNNEGIRSGNEEDTHQDAKIEEGIVYKQRGFDMERRRMEKELRRFAGGEVANGTELLKSMAMVVADITSLRAAVTEEHEFTVQDINKKENDDN